MHLSQHILGRLWQYYLNSLCPDVLEMFKTVSFRIIDIFLFFYDESNSNNSPICFSTTLRNMLNVNMLALLLKLCWLHMLAVWRHEHWIGMLSDYFCVWLLLTVTHIGLFIENCSGWWMLLILSYVPSHLLTCSMPSSQHKGQIDCSMRSGVPALQWVLLTFNFSKKL